MSENLFDIDALMGQCAGKKEIAEAVLDEFLSQTPKDLAEIAEVLGVGNWDALSKIAHRLKGTAGVLGAKTLFDQCAALETACRSNDTASAPGLCATACETAQACIDYVPTLKTQLK